MGGVKILNGRYEGAEIEILPGQELVIGRDVHQCQFVIESSWISRVHVRIRYDEESGSYKVTDESTHGTFDSDKKRFPNGKTVECARQTIINVGEDGISILLL